MIKLPDNLRSIGSDIELKKELFNQTEKLFLVGDDQFILDIAKSLSFPKWLDSNITFIIKLTNIGIKINKKYKTYPICANVSFYRRPQDDMIVAVSHPSSLVVHYDLYKEGLLNILPQIKESPRLKLADDSVTHYRFKHWCEENPENRKSKIKKILNGNSTRSE